MRSFDDNKSFSLKCEREFLTAYYRRFSDNFAFADHETLEGNVLQTCMHIDAMYVPRGSSEIIKVEHKFRAYSPKFRRDLCFPTEEAWFKRCRADRFLFGVVADPEQTQLDIYTYLWPALREWVVGTFGPGKHFISTDVIAREKPECCLKPITIVLASA